MSAKFEELVRVKCKMDFMTFEKNMKEYSCRLCLSSKETYLNSFSNEIKRKIKKLFDIEIRKNDKLPKAVCHTCLQQLNECYRFFVNVERIQQHVQLYEHKINLQSKSSPMSTAKPAAATSKANVTQPKEGIYTHSTNPKSKNKLAKPKNVFNPQKKCQSKSVSNLEYGDSNNNFELLEDRIDDAIKKASQMSKISNDHGEQFEYGEQGAANGRKNGPQLKKPQVAKCRFENTLTANPKYTPQNNSYYNLSKIESGTEVTTIKALPSDLDTVIIIDGKPAKEGEELYRQISLFYDMVCGICKSTFEDFRLLVRHYKDGHGVPGYVACCGKKIHSFYLKKIVEHLALHVQPDAFKCPSCDAILKSSHALQSHKDRHIPNNLRPYKCPNCPLKFIRQKQLAIHVSLHQDIKEHCEYCGKWINQTQTKILKKMTTENKRKILLCIECSKKYNTYCEEEPVTACG